MGKGEIAHHEQFLLFPQCFQNNCTADMTHKNQSLFGKELKAALNTIHSITTEHSFNSGYVGKQPVARKEYCTECW